MLFLSTLSCEPLTNVGRGADEIAGAESPTPVVVPNPFPARACQLKKRLVRTFSTHWANVLTIKIGTIKKEIVTINEASEM